jgi:hypothetical protein
MTRLICLLASFAVLASSGCIYRCGCDPDPTPTHTFGAGGVVDRAGGLRGPREYCPTCEWYGTTCPACRAKQAAECAKCRHDEVVVAKDAPKGEADRMLKSLEAKKIAPTTTTVVEAKPFKATKVKGRKPAASQTNEPASEPEAVASPYAPMRDNGLLRTSR